MRAIDEGAPAGPIARELAVQVLTMPPRSAGWACALSVLEAGGARMRHAIELAGHVLDAAADDERAGDANTPTNRG